MCQCDFCNWSSAAESEMESEVDVSEQLRYICCYIYTSMLLLLMMMMLLSFRSRRDAVDYLTWTFYFVRLLANPSFYGLEDTSTEGVQVGPRLFADALWPILRLCTSASSS